MRLSMTGKITVVWTSVLVVCCPVRRMSEIWSGIDNWWQLLHVFAWSITCQLASRRRDTRAHTSHPMFIWIPSSLNIVTGGAAPHAYPGPGPATVIIAPPGAAPRERGWGFIWVCRDQAPSQIWKHEAPLLATVPPATRILASSPADLCSLATCSNNVISYISSFRQECIGARRGITAHSWP